MNPREFCWGRHYPSAILLTYSFDALFFERVTLPDLWAGGTGDILVVGDQVELEATAQRGIGQLRHLGRRYLVAAGNTRGAFHPKVMLRLGPSGALVWIGSGNVTFGGWGGNRELSVAWRVGPGQADTGFWLGGLIDRIADWCTGPLEREALTRMRELTWLVGGDATGAAPLLTAYARESLASQLQRRWAGRRFTEVRILTGSTDREGAFLRWAHETFGVERAVVALQPESADFDASKLASLPLKTEIIPVHDPQRLHAKLCWFNGPEGAAAVMGSANCSAAAWLVPPDFGGNVEVVVPWDVASPGQFGAVLKMFDGDRHAPEDVLLERAADHGPPPREGGISYRITGARWEPLIGQLLIKLKPAPPGGATVNLDIDGEIVRLEPAGSADLSQEWSASPPESIGVARTLFARAIIRTHDRTFVTALHWIDDTAELRHSIKGHQFTKTLPGLARPQTAEQDRQLLEDLQLLATALFSQPTAFPDPFATRESVPPPPDRETPATAVDPDKLVRTLAELEEHKSGTAHAGPTGTLSLVGVMRVLFAAYETDSLGEEVDPAQEPDLDDDSDDKPPDKKPAKKPLHPRPPETKPPEKLRARFTSQMDEFFTELRRPAFQQNCTVTQLVQAIAFPLAATVLSERRGWVERKQAARWTTTLIGLLLRGASTGLAAPGLLEHVRTRYATADRANVFAQVIGDGALWAALTAALGALLQDADVSVLERALVLRDVFMQPELVSQLTPERLGHLVERLDVAGAKATILKTAPTITEILNELEAYLHKHWEHLKDTQVQPHLHHSEGDMLWRPEVGWVTAREDAAIRNKVNLRAYFRNSARETKIYSAGYYANVSLGARDEPALTQLLNRLRDALSNSGQTLKPRLEPWHPSGTQRP